MHARTLIASSVLALGTLGLVANAPAADASNFPIPFPGGDIFGQVRAGASGLPAGEGLEVTISRKGVVLATDTTDEFSQFQFEDLRPGTYTVTVNKVSRNVSIGSFSAFVTLFVK